MISSLTGLLLCSHQSVFFSGKVLHKSAGRAYSPFLLFYFRTILYSSLRRGSVRTQRATKEIAAVSTCYESLPQGEEYGRIRKTEVLWLYFSAVDSSHRGKCTAATDKFMNCIRTFRLCIPPARGNARPQSTNS